MKIKANTKHKPVFWLAGDSTMQSYTEAMRPQWGWGECLLSTLEEKFVEMVRNDMLQEGVMGFSVVPYVARVQAFHRDSCPFMQQKRYVGRYFELDNCAMAGRSSKTFREEGRLADMEQHMKNGDYMLIQFGHNDCARQKPERYVALSDYKASLATYVEMAVRHGVTPILLSSIAICPSQDVLGDEVEEITKQLPRYASVMEEYAKEQQILYINVYHLTYQYLQSMTIQEAEAMYLPDHVHLTFEGAQHYAELVAEQLKEVLRRTKY
ncbi:MAG: hypothetical protein IJF07_03175 [Lachnospiraceae bacterium]|nr:hypothetical protein [Lachnospiraceae bacterium]